MESQGTKKRDKKDFHPKNLFRIIQYSLQGLQYFFQYERSAIVYLVASILGLMGAWMLHMSPMEWLVIILLLVMILSAELLNTAIEAVCNLVSPEYNPYVKIAKDCGSAATFVLSTVGIAVGFVMYIPKIIELVETFW